MKLFFVGLMITCSAFSMDFNKVTGTFDVSEDKKSLTHKIADAETFDIKQDGRKPASQEKDKSVHVTELSGTFK